MGEIHQLIIQHGRDRAKELVPPEQRGMVEAAAAVLADESRHLGITYSGFCLTALPHRRIDDDAVWERIGHRVTLVVEPGRLRIAGEDRKFGVPYGSKARLVLLYLQTKAIQTNSREVPLGRSMHDWMRSLNVSTGGKNYRDLKEQCNRLSACSLKFYWEGDRAGTQRWAKDTIITGGLTFNDEDVRQGSLWEEQVYLGEHFFRSLKEHPVPVLESAIREISNRSMAIDVYIWLAYRLHVIEEPTMISYAALYSQFGAGFDNLRRFRHKFPESLYYALSVYPEAKAEVRKDGVLLYPSPPAVASDRRAAAAIGY
ncbi:replication protein RepA [Azospirillum sp. TSO35-2]|uniref:replication protein RepA n=1 Tax=Azospirillum sp. TSO35-2 TaxID=716796 RepID=UPI000D61361B|nr:replication protein RepA [Azospirillum sp. TSO35-2]PWC32829.1 pirin [Azospirillum sp. TSO35-2]